MEDLLKRFESISLDRMDSVKLMNRVDTKFVVTAEQLEAILEQSFQTHYALEIGGKRLMSYDSVYFDTSDHEMYTRHHDKRLVRRKVRTRMYVDSGDTFLEIKFKNNHSRTKKRRIAISGTYLEDFHGDEYAADYVSVQTGYQPDSLTRALRTSFKRITLVDKDLKERVTIDSNLEFQNLRNSNAATLNGLVIIELKQDSSVTSPMRILLRNLRIKPLRVSKYCIGTALTDPEIKQNNFKEKIRTLNKLSNVTSNTAGI